MVIFLKDMECPRCGAVGTLEIERDVPVGEDVAVECSSCGRQHPGRREPVDSAFDFSGAGR